MQCPDAAALMPTSRPSWGNAAGLPSTPEERVCSGGRGATPVLVTSTESRVRVGCENTGSSFRSLLVTGFLGRHTEQAAWGQRSDYVPAASKLLRTAKPPPPPQGQTLGARNPCWLGQERPTSSPHPSFWPLLEIQDRGSTEATSGRGWLPERFCVAAVCACGGLARSLHKHGAVAEVSSAQGWRPGTAQRRRQQSLPFSCPDQQQYRH